MLVEKNKKAAISGNNINDLDEVAIKKSLGEAKKENKLILLLDAIGGIVVTAMVIAALTTIVPICLLILLGIVGIGYLVFYVLL